MDALSDTTIRGADWYGRDLDRDEYTKVAFFDVDMTELTSPAAVFTECTFTNVRFNVSTHTDSAFVNCAFSRCNFFDATFDRCKLTGSMFDGCAFDLMKVAGRQLVVRRACPARSQRDDFDGVRLREADLNRVALRRRDVRRLRPVGRVDVGVDFTGADLRGSDLGAHRPAHRAAEGRDVDERQAAVLVEALGLSFGPD